MKTSTKLLTKSSLFFSYINMMIRLTKYSFNFSGIDTYLNHHETCIIHIYIFHSRSQLNSGLTTLFLN